MRQQGYAHRSVHPPCSSNSFALSKLIDRQSSCIWASQSRARWFSYTSNRLWSPRHILYRGVAAPGIRYRLSHVREPAWKIYNICIQLEPINSNYRYSAISRTTQHTAPQRTTLFFTDLQDTRQRRNKYSPASTQLEMTSKCMLAP